MDSTIRDVREKKLPKWAIGLLKNLRYQRMSIVKTLNNILDSSTPSPFFHESYVWLGDDSGPTVKREYIQTNMVTCVHEGIRVSITAIPDEPIQIAWSNVDRITGEVGCVPESFQRIRLVKLED